MFLIQFINNRCIAITFLKYFICHLVQIKYHYFLWLSFGLWKNNIITQEPCARHAGKIKAYNSLPFGIRLDVFWSFYCRRRPKKNNNTNLKTNISSSQHSYRTVLKRWQIHIIVNYYCYHPSMILSRKQNIWSNGFLMKSAFADFRLSYLFSLLLIKENANLKCQIKYFKIKSTLHFNKFSEQNGKFLFWKTSLVIIYTPTKSRFTVSLLLLFFFLIGNKKHERYLF